MMKVRTDVADKMYNMMLLFVLFILCPITCFAEAVVDALTDVAVMQPCETKCGCKEVYIYDAVNDRCLINFKKVMKKVIIVYRRFEHLDYEVENLFKVILISAIIFVACASVCIVSACIYCYRINYTDRTLKKNVKAVAKKLHTDYNSMKMAPKRAPLPAISESCSVLVEPAGVMVV